MRQAHIHQVLKQKYTYTPNSPQFVSVDGKYKIYKALQKDITLNVTIKILMGSPDPTLTNYLNKLKGTKSEQVIKIYEIISETNFLVLITQQVIYGTMAMGLLNCKKFDEYDALYVGKYLLSGYTDILRSGIQWFGTLNDIQITESGIKISWNNAVSISSQASNIFKQVLQNLSTQKVPQNEPRLLPFPQSKQMKELIRLSQSSASQISLAPMMKKKEKYIKKKIKNYLLIRETKSNNQYFDETVYLGVSKEEGFVRVKAYKKGVIKPAVLELNKTKNTFTKVLQIIEQGNLLYVISAYSNDGTLQAYVQRLKNAGILLKEDQIQFFFYSLFEPLKAIQQSSIKSLNTSLHIKNIYLQSGIPKIGDPIPLNEESKQKLLQRKDVPDFYHPGFKETPNESDPSFDTYSLGVLLYKLMFTEFPIFPGGKVHIPTTPTFSPRLKKTLEIFLNKGGRLADLQKQIQVSQNALKQIKKNKQKLLSSKKAQQKKLKGQKKRYQQVLVSDDEDIQKKSHKQDQEKEKITHQQEQEQQDIQDDCFECCVNLDIADHSIDPQVQSLEESPYKTYRLFTKLLCFLLLYILLMYMFYLRQNIDMLVKQSNLSQLNVTISTIRYEIVTESSADFYLAFNQTSKVYSDLINMGCLINLDKGNAHYFQFVHPNSWRWILFLAGGLSIFLLIIVMKSLLNFKFDYIRVKYNYQHNLTNFNYSNYFIVHLLIACLINQHFYFFNMIFYSTLPGCLGDKKARIYSTTDFMLNDNQNFMVVHLPVICALTVVAFVHFIVVYNTMRIKYSKIINPIIFATPFMLIYWVVVRIGVFTTYFYPSVLTDSQSIVKSYFIQGDYIGIIGIVPQVLLVIQFLINKLIDLFYWMLIDKKRRVMIQENSTENIQIYQ